MPLRLVHMTDIFHPHGDPDDHYDLALAFALHAQGYLELYRVIMDYPPDHRLGDPALCAAAQLNEITHSNVPACVAPAHSQAAGEMILSILRSSDRPVAFSVVGTSAHIAAALRMNPSLFAQKCAGIYLAAGVGLETPSGDLEYNVALNPAAYSTVLSAPCPLFWAPCFHTILPGGLQQGGEYASVYALPQKDLLNHLPPAMQQYFLYMHTRSADPKYLRYLLKPVDTAALAEHGEPLRRLWSTPLLLHAAGIACDSFEFLPVHIDSRPDGHTSWIPDRTSAAHIFHIPRCDRETTDSFDATGRYQAEMVSKLRQLLGSL